MINVSVKKPAYKPSYDTLRVFTLLIIIIQSIGIRFFPGQGTVLSVVILFLCRRGFLNFRRKDFTILFTIFSFLIINKILNPSFELSALIFQSSIVLSSYIFLLQYKSTKPLIEDLYACLKFVFIHALLGFVVYLLASPLFLQVKLSGLTYKTFFFIFYVGIGDTGDSIRNTGLCWEPGVLQLALNLFLFFSIKRNKSVLFLGLILLAILSTFSTAGYIIIVLNGVYYIIQQAKTKGNIGLIVIVGLLFSTIIFALIKQNTSKKFDSSNTSGLVRLRDYYIGLELISEKPLLGHGIFDTKYLKSISSVAEIESNLFTDEFLDQYGDLSGGYTNGLLALICYYGIPVALYIYVLVFKNRFVGTAWYEKLIFFLILCMSCLSEPITYTSFFLLFPFSNVIFAKRVAKVPAKISYKPPVEV